MPLAALAVLLAAAAAVASSSPDAGLTPPNTSLATPPMTYFGGVAATRSAANLAMLARQRMVMIEKWEGHCWADCLTNTSAGRPCLPTCHGELDMLATLRKVKGRNPSVAGGYYQNSLYDWTFQLLDATMGALDGNMRDAAGRVIRIEQDNGLKNQNVFSLDRASIVDAWLGWQRNLSMTGCVDGTFLDKSNVYPTFNKTANSWQLCENPSGPGKHAWADACALITDTQATAYAAGRDRLLQELYGVWRPRGGFTMGNHNTTMRMVHFRKSVDAAIKDVRSALAEPTVDYVFLMLSGDQQYDHDPADTASQCKNGAFAVGLLAVERGVLLSCNGWDDDFGKPLGEPAGPAQQDGDVYTRAFSTGTTVSYNSKTEKSVIHWADGSVSRHH